ncbi:hypothetical protein TrispH2_001800 [Trichoplax sp. H2]|nr:hypothetical protein TrispH2_001800 [Trichoplax sp. H2]|eukprot:RDD46007.1 hypothetical protein TrispH2_001800 [Trichoplax sp. H2]
MEESNSKINKSQRGNVAELIRTCVILKWVTEIDTVSISVMSKLRLQTIEYFCLGESEHAAKQETLEVNFVVSDNIHNPIIIIDLPEMLQDYQLKQHIQHYFRQLLLQNNYEFINGISKVTFRYVTMDNDTVKVTLHKDYDNYL